MKEFLYVAYDLKEDDKKSYLLFTYRNKDNDSIIQAMGDLQFLVKEHPFADIKFGFTTLNREDLREKLRRYNE